MSRVEMTGPARSLHTLDTSEDEDTVFSAASFIRRPPAAAPVRLRVLTTLSAIGGFLFGRAVNGTSQNFSMPRVGLVASPGNQKLGLLLALLNVQLCKVLLTAQM